MASVLSTIIFDWNDTLSLGIPEGYFPIEKVKNEFELDDKTVSRCLKVIDEFEIPVEPTTIKEQRKILTDCYRLLSKKIKIRASDLFIQYLLSWSFEKAIPVLFPDVLDTLDYFYKKNYALAVLTNGWPTRLLEIKRSGAEKYFKSILVSSLIGAAKPQLEAYRIAIKEIGVSSDKILFVDNKETYLVPAKNLGMKTLLMDRKDLYANTSFSKIRMISEIINYLK